MFLGTDVFPCDFKTRKQITEQNKEKDGNKVGKNEIKLKRKRDKWKGGSDTRTICSIVSARPFVSSDMQH
jgi:hypothetical protein